MLPALSRIAALAFMVTLTTSFSPTVVVPNFPDLTIRTRESFGSNISIRMTWYFKGPRQRTEQIVESSPLKTTVIITQCDQGSYFILNDQRKTYLTNPVDQMAGKDSRKLLARSDDTVDVVVTTDSIDTGERRRVGSYEARRVKTTTTIEGNEEAGVLANKIETDGWYIDLPGWNCRDDSGRGQGMIMAGTGRRMPHYVFRQLGTARRGFPIDETTVTTQAGSSTTNRNELLEISEGPLDPALFEVPADYTRVTHPAEP